MVVYIMETVFPPQSVMAKPISFLTDSDKKLISQCKSLTHRPVDHPPLAMCLTGARLVDG